MGQLSQLRKLDISDNQLTELAESLKNLTSLKEFYLSGNPALGLPAEILGSSQSVTRRNVKPSEVLQYYLRVRLGKRPLNEAKLILIGRGAVGKTSIVNRLVHNRFGRDEAKTEGIQITDWKLQLPGKEKVRLNIWDFGGQEIMHATHQFFLTKRSIYLVVLNGREGGEDADAEYWLKLVETFGGESPIIIVLNKILEHPFDLNRRALQKKYPAIKHFIKTDCLHEIGIEELRRLLEFETDRLDHLRDSFPSSWFGIKDQLSAMGTNYFSFEEYRKFCDRNGESDPAAQDALASYLHNLGIVLNYREDPRLQDTHVLNPHWVTNGIYKILNSERLERQKGEICLNELAEILDPVAYPLHMCRFIVDLMKKFDLCFSFPNNEFNFLIPELLDKQEPEETVNFRPEECLHFQFDYPVLPEGLLPRFIVRTHTLSEHPTSKRWRTGVILEFEGCSALVKADVQDKKIFISVMGPQKSRRRLLAIIRVDLGRIHRDLHNLQPAEMVPVPNHPDVVIPYDDLILWESNNRATYPVRAGGRLVDLHVQDLLNGVDLEFRGGKLDEDDQPLRLFYSYSHKDENLRNELETHLKLMNRQHLISSWYDRNIEAGDDWKRNIDENLERADIILLLVSPDFIASDYCYEVEMKRAMERHAKREARVIPIIVRDVSWTLSPVSELQALPRNGKAITLWDDKDSAWRSVSEDIERVINSFEELNPQLKGYTSTILNDLSIGDHK